MLYHFEGVSLGYLPNSLKVPDPNGYNLVEFKEIYSKWDGVFATRGWGSIYLGKGGDLQAFLEAQKISARDNSRTPFQWDQTANAGFTSGGPWLKVNPNYTTINAAAQESDPRSCLNYFRKLVALRKANPVLIYGKYVLLDKENPDVYAYTRELDGRKLLVLLNFRDTAASVDTGLELGKAKVIFGNYPTPSPAGRLQPYEAVIYEF